MSSLQGLTGYEGCCCAPGTTPSCMPPFRGGNSCGAHLEIQLDWTSVKRQQWDNYFALIQCGLPALNECCEAAQGQCCSDYLALCNTGTNTLEHTYCNGGTLPCSAADVTPENICDGCYNNNCTLWVEPNESVGSFQLQTFRLCAWGYAAEWIPSLLSKDAACIYDEIVDPRQANCNTQIDAQTVYQGTRIVVKGLPLDECSCEPDPCYPSSGRTEMTVSNNNAVWRIGAWCTDGIGNVLYPQRSNTNAFCENLGNTDCAIEEENFCLFDKSYCAMASNNLIPLTGGYKEFADIDRTYPIGSGASGFAITNAGTGYIAGTRSQLQYVAGGSSAPNPNGAPFIEIVTVNGVGGITAIALLLNGEGDKISVGQTYNVAGGVTACLVTITSVVAWDAATKPWYRIKLRTIPVEQSQLQADPLDEELALERCKDLLQVTDDLAHFCKYKDCLALPFSSKCPTPCTDFEAVTQPLWIDTNYAGDGYQSDLHFMGRTLDNGEKHPWVTLAFHRYWELDPETNELVRNEIKYHCFGTQHNYQKWWQEDSAGVWLNEGTVTAFEGNELWLGIRGDNYNIKDAETGVWYGYDDNHYSECNNLQGLRGSVPANPFCPGCEVAVCSDENCAGEGKWLPDNSDEVRIGSMTASKVSLEGRPRYHYKYQLLNYDRSSYTATQVL